MWWESHERGALELIVYLVVFLGALVTLSHFGGRWWMERRGRAIARVLPLLPDDVGFELGPGAGVIEVHGADPTIALVPRSGAEAEELRTGDPAFDGAVRVFGDPFRLRAHLDAPTRAQVVALVRARGDVANGTVRARLTSASAPAVAARVAIARTLAERLRPFPGPEVPERLTRIALEDPVGRVRLLAFEALAGILDKAEHAALAARLIHDADPFVRVEAATATDPPGAAQLFGLRRHESRAVRKAAILATARLPDAVAALTAHLATGGDPALVAEALGRAGDPAGEPLLLAMLADPEVFPIVVDALGAVGTVRAIEPLLAERDGPYGSRVADTIARIRGRLGDVEAGRLSLHDGGGGEVSLAAEAGQLTVVPPDRVPSG